MKRAEKLKTSESNNATPGGSFPFYPWQSYLLVCALCGLLYGKAVFFGYTYMDDYGLIVENFRFLGNISNLFKAFGLDVFGIRYGSMYRPVFTVSLMLDAWWAGIQPWTYHLTNIILHAANGCLIYQLLVGLGHKARVALIAALIFIVHPALSTAVAWIGGRNDSLMTFWILLSFISLINLRRVGRYPWAVVSLLAWGLALFTKEPALLFPLAGSVYLWITKNENSVKRELQVLIPGWIVIGLLYLLARWNVARPGLSSDPMFFSSLTENVNGLLSYIYKGFIPARLSVYAGYDRINFWLGALALVLLAVWFRWRGIKDKKMFLFGLGWFLLFLAPYAWRGVDYANFLEHRLYLPAVGLVLMLLESKPLEKIKPKIAYGIWSAIIVLLAFLTFARLPVFADGLAFWESAVKSSPHLYCVHDVLGKVYYDRGELENAGREFRKSMVLKPEYAYSYNNLGMIWLRQNRVDSAMGYFRQALKLKTDYAEAWSNLGTVYYQLGDLNSAKQNFQAAVKVDSTSAIASNGLGLIYARQDSLDKAEVWYLKAAGLDPLNSAAYYNLGFLYAGLNQPVRAAECFQKVIELEPYNYRAHQELGIIFFKQKEFAAAEAELKKALSGDPDNPVNNNYLALTYLGLKNAQMAAWHYQRAVDGGMKPDPRILKILGNARNQAFQP
jgi:Tfp pilus assembly protein PilF